MTLNFATIASKFILGHGQPIIFTRANTTRKKSSSYAKLRLDTEFFYIFVNIIFLFTIAFWFIFFVQI